MIYLHERWKVATWTRGNGWVSISYMEHLGFNRMQQIVFLLSCSFVQKTVFQLLRIPFTVLAPFEPLAKTCKEVRSSWMCVFFIVCFFSRDAGLKSIGKYDCILLSRIVFCCFSLFFCVLVWTRILFEVHHSPCKHQLEDMSFVENFLLSQSSFKFRTLRLLFKDSITKHFRHLKCRYSPI